MRQSAARNRKRRKGAEYTNVPQKDGVGERGKEIGWSGRYKQRERADLGKCFVLSMFVSCGDGIRDRWRTELDVSGGKPFDDLHRPTALGAEPRIARTGSGNLLFGLWM